MSLSYHPEINNQRDAFSLVYGSDAMIPVEIQENSLLFQSFVVEEFNEWRMVNLNSLDEVREHARINSKALKRRVELKQKTKKKSRQFKVADLVMRKAHSYELENKLSPKRTDSFRVVEVLGNGAYRLETLETLVSRGTWKTSSFTSDKTSHFNAFFLTMWCLRWCFFFLERVF